MRSWSWALTWTNAHTSNGGASRVRGWLSSSFTPEIEPAVGESDQSVRALQLIPSRWVQLSVQQIWRQCCSLCVPFQAHQRTPQGALKGSSGDRKPVHVVPNVSVQFALCTATQSLAHISERSVRWDTLALHSWGSGGLSSEGINSAANRCFHLAYKHSISVSHCILLPPC